jgi:hypothetical protein
MHVFPARERKIRATWESQASSVSEDFYFLGRIRGGEEKGGRRGERREERRKEGRGERREEEGRERGQERGEERRGEGTS